MRFLHTGDLGDIIAALPTMRSLGGGELVISDILKNNRQRMRGARYASIKSLLEAQPYIKSVQWSDHPSQITHNFASFRLKHYFRGQSLLEWQARYFNVEPNCEPWIEVESGKIGVPIISRTCRYRNESFPWREILSFYADAIFVGLKEEHEAFEKEFSIKIEYVPTPTLLDLAQLIAGATIFVGNQSAPLWIAFALGQRIIQETWTYEPNSILPRSNALYTQTEDEIKLLREAL